MHIFSLSTLISWVSSFCPPSYYSSRLLPCTFLWTSTICCVSFPITNVLSIFHLTKILCPLSPELSCITISTSNTPDMLLLAGGLILLFGSLILRDGSCTSQQSSSRSGFGQNSESRYHAQSPSLTLLTAPLFSVAASMEFLNSILTGLPAPPLPCRHLTQKHHLYWYVNSSGWGCYSYLLLQIHVSGHIEKYSLG